MSWYVSSDGEIVQAEDYPGKNWSQMPDPEKVDPDALDADEICHSVTDRIGMLVFVPTVIDSGEWVRTDAPILTYAEFKAELSAPDTEVLVQWHRNGALTLEVFDMKEDEE